MNENNMELEKSILLMIIDRLSLEDIDVDNYDYDMPIFAAEDESGLCLDSVDALEIVVGLKKDFNVEMEKEDTEVFRTIRRIADYVREKRAEVNQDGE